MISIGVPKSLNGFTFRMVIDSIFSAVSGGRGLSSWHAIAMDSPGVCGLASIALPEALSNLVSVFGYSKENPQNVLV